ncbi:hypothetical protein L211DRAFT_847617 [Terfezia boudieri ATCC MYA-4762]|uniref:Uncharacterized protein n=1 Tax=Terfezia boudieri ATCC MYA-4762 TaxID=1051890 RepID=A0A3N4LVX8_9PEZI|nr:hypothetical protein L211DRAFT_847617 [Terfezia boudieri ATCC MYA-4762]
MRSGPVGIAPTRESGWKSHSRGHKRWNSTRSVTLWDTVYATSSYYSIYNTPGPVIPQFGPDFPFDNLSKDSNEAAAKIRQAKLSGFCKDLLSGESDSNDNDDELPRPVRRSSKPVGQIIIPIRALTPTLTLGQEGVEAHIPAPIATTTDASRLLKVGI